MKFILPILILLTAAGITTVLVMFKPDAAEISPERPVTRVEVIEIQPQSAQLTVKSQGTLLPSSETDLIAEVNGRVIEVAENFQVGRRFQEDDVLLIIDPADYEANLALRTSELANAELALAQELANAEQAAADWTTLGEGEASDLTLRKPQLAQARALVASAEAALKKTQRDLERTRIKAPYDGIVLDKQVDLGQFITANPADPLGRIYATGSAEVRLPITEKEAALLDTHTEEQPMVFLKQFGHDSELVWQAPLVRTEDNIDPGSRLLYAVARIQNPFEPTEAKPALRRGTFLEAEIEGRTLTDVYVLPRYALRGSDSVYVVNGANTLETRKVTIVQSDAEEIVITDGLNPGDRVAVSPIAYHIENMPVEVIE